MTAEQAVAIAALFLGLGFVVAHFGDRKQGGNLLDLLLVIAGGLIGGGLTKIILWGCQ